MGNHTWRKRVLKAIPPYHRFLFFDRIHIGGGNAKHLNAERPPGDARIVPNTAGISGGVRIWDLDT